ncbi:MAG: hypothetical protein ACREXK_01900 [Gammaproteobacteria bacterium]
MIEPRNGSSQIHIVATHYATAIGLIFLITYACSLTFVYVEGDDAASVAYHALGRNPAVQAPYSPYQGMMDVLLGILPANERLLRTAAISVTAVGTIAAFTLVFCLAFQRLSHLNRSRQTLTAIAILLAVPEVFYFGLVYTPTVVALFFVLTAHCLARYHRDREGTFELSRFKRNTVFGLSALMFGVGTACRWDIGLYGLVIVADLILRENPDGQIARIEKRRLVYGAFWGCWAAIAAFAAIAFSGYGIGHVVAVLDLSRKEVSREISWFAILGSTQTFFTPAFSLFLITGLWSFIRRRRKLFIIVLVGIVPIIPFILTRPKILLASLPVLFLCAAEGVNVIWSTKRSVRQVLFIRAAVLLLLISPWLIGINVETKDTTWGPGFDVGPYDKSSAVTSEHGVVSGQVRGHKVTLDRVYAVLGGGFAVHTPEGPRPLGGHAAVLFGGSWRALVIKMSQDRFEAIEQARSLRVDLVQVGDLLFLTADLTGLGFTTTDPPTHRLPGGLVVRRFTNAKGEQLNLYYVKYPRTLADDQVLDGLASAMRKEEMVLYSRHNPTRKQLYMNAPEAVQTINAFSSVIDVRELIEAKMRKPFTIPK